MDGMIVLYAGIAIILLLIIYKFHRSHVELHDRFKQILEVERIRQDIERGREEAMISMINDNVDLRKRVERLETEC